MYMLNPIPHARRSIAAAIIALVALLAPGSASLHADPVNPAAGVDFAAIEAQLCGDGITGRMHAAVAAQGLFVWTWRSPTDFFTSAQFPLVSHVPAVASVLPTLARHDKIKIKGQFIENGAPQRHIYVTSLEIVEKWDGSDATQPYDYDTSIPADLLASTSMLARVHAVDGSVLVLEFGDAVVPVFVRANSPVTALVATLWRGDKISMEYRVREFPDRPAHIEPNPDVEQPITVLSRISEQHDQPADLTGILSLYPRSPQIIFDVYALHHVDERGLALEYTLVNFENQAVFAAIREKLAAAWAARPAGVVNGRNKLFNTRVEVRARGTFNVVSPSQANPQILLTSPDDVQIRFLDSETY